MLESNKDVFFIFKKYIEYLLCGSMLSIGEINVNYEFWFYEVYVLVREVFKKKRKKE